jgi:pyruvate-ferredoxin/flavodoxin oxidoreductase
VTSIAVLDRTKEPGAAGEPLYQDVLTALAEAMADGSLTMPQFPKVLGGRYGLSSKEFTPRWSRRVRQPHARQPKNHFTVGINEDVTHSQPDVWDHT